MSCDHVCDVAVSLFRSHTLFALDAAFLKKHTGTGGLTSSMKLGTKPRAPAKPVAGAFKKRVIPPSEFRRFYDRCDLPICVVRFARIHSLTLLTSLCTGAHCIWEQCWLESGLRKA